MIPVKTIHPTYTLTLPSNKKTIKFRPFLEMERKILMIAAESKDENEILLAIKEVIHNCCPDINPDILPLFDIEYIFLQLRAKSIGEVMKLTFRCHNGAPDNTCGNVMKIDVDLTTAEVVGLKKDLKIKFTPTFGVTMRYPNLTTIKSDHAIDTREYLYDVLASSIDVIWENEDMYYTKDYSKQDVLDFIMHLTYDQFEKLEDFIVDLPSVQKTFKHTCEKCKFEHEITLEGYQSFFL